MKKILTTSLLATVAMTAAAYTPWFHLYHNRGNFTSMPCSEVDGISHETLSNGLQRMYIHHAGYGKEDKTAISLSEVNRWVIGPNVATFRITTNSFISEVSSKETYLEGSLQIDGAGIFDDFSGDILIRGRGNSTWAYPKKAYRIKLPEKTKLCGYRKAKNYVLLANYIDVSMMRNEAACLATQYVGADFPTHATPVDVYFNDIYKGSYMLIEKVGINNGSVNMPAAQEAESFMFQIDKSYDEDLKVLTPKFRLPLMHKDPDAPEDPAEAKAWFDEWCEDFFAMEEAVASGKNIGNYIDYTSLAKYLFVYNLTANQEINHPKSIYMYKTKGGKWLFGPAWDFDWAFGYSPTYQTASPDQTSQEEIERMYNEALQIALERYGYGRWGFIEYNGMELMWTGQIFYRVEDDNYYPWPDQYISYEPSYRNYLLGVGKNLTPGNGGEFFLSMIIDNPEFMEAYKQVWTGFQANINSFWADFEAYAKALEPSAARNATVWGATVTDPVDPEFADMVSDKTYVGAINQLREWIKKRLEFISDPANNYGLYNPSTTYQRGTVPQQ